MRVTISVLLFTLASLLVGWTWMSSTPRQMTIDTSGHENARPDALLINGWLVANYGEANIKDTYLRYQAFLGEPVSGFDGTSQTFRFGRLSYYPGNPEVWKVELDNLGALDMEAQGYTPRPGRTPHPALRDWLLSERENGLDTVRVVGQIISDPVCDSKTGQCRQWTDKTLFEFSQDALTGDQVHRAPIGLWISYPQARAVGASSPSLNWPVLVAAVLAVLAGVAVLRGSSVQRSRIPI